MSDLSEARAELAKSILACPDEHTIWLKLWDGPTIVAAVPSDNGNVVILISDKMGLHLTLTPEMALRLSADLAWAAREMQIEAHELEATP